MAKRLDIEIKIYDEDDPDAKVIYIINEVAARIADGYKFFDTRLEGKGSEATLFFRYEDFEPKTFKSELIRKIRTET